MSDTLAGKRIVVVEDDTTISFTLKEWFGLHNEVHVYDSAEEALDALDPTYITDVFIVDHFLTGMTGADFFKQIRPRYPQSKFILITGDLNLQMALEGQEMGYDALILKPFDLVILEKNIANLVAA